MDEFEKLKLHLNLKRVKKKEKSTSVTTGFCKSQATCCSSKFVKALSPKGRRDRKWSHHFLGLGKLNLSAFLVFSLFFGCVDFTLYLFFHTAPRAAFKIPGYRPSEMDKKFLVWSGRFKTVDQIPELVS